VNYYLPEYTTFAVYPPDNRDPLLSQPGKPFTVRSADVPAISPNNFTVVLFEPGLATYVVTPEFANIFHTSTGEALVYFELRADQALNVASTAIAVESPPR
jgi:hypothetical protein